MHIVVDIGNTRIKTGEFTEDELLQSQVFDSLAGLYAYISDKQYKAALISSVGISAEDIAERLHSDTPLVSFSHATPVPVKVNYATPETLGLDRLAAVCGAWQLMPGEPVLAIDAGTCITYDLLDGDGVYHGGIISPGLRMKARALHNFTARLPLVDIPDEVELTGTTTMTCLQSGVLNGTKAEIREFIRMYREKISNLRIVMCGGDAGFFKFEADTPVKFVPELVLLGLNTILKYNV